MPCSLTAAQFLSCGGRWQHLHINVPPGLPHPPHVQELGTLTEAALQTPRGAVLVHDCAALYRQLCSLTRLDDPGLLPPVGGMGTCCSMLSVPLLLPLYCRPTAEHAQRSSCRRLPCRQHHTSYPVGSI